MKITYLILLVGLNFNLMAQDILKYVLRDNDQLAIRLEIKQKIKEDNCVCPHQQKQLCVLYQAVVDSILFKRPNIDYYDGLDAGDTIYVLQQEPIEIQEMKKYVLIVYQSYYEYFAINYITNNISIIIVDQPSGSYISGVGPCIKSGYWRFLLKLKLVKPENAKILPKDKNHFWISIQNLNTKK